MNETVLVLSPDAFPDANTSLFVTSVMSKDTCKYMETSPSTPTCGVDPAPPPPAPPPSPPLPHVTLTVTLGGLTVAQLNTSSGLSAFKDAVGATLSVDTQYITITSISASSRRRLLSAGVAVTFTVATTASASALTRQLSTGPAFAAQLAAFFISAGLPAPSAITVHNNNAASSGAAAPAKAAAALVAAALALLC